MSWKLVFILSFSVSTLACATASAQTRIPSYRGPDCNAFCDLYEGMRNMFSQTQQPAPASTPAAPISHATAVVQKQVAHRPIVRKDYVGRSVYVRRAPVRLAPFRPAEDFRLYAEGKIMDVRDLQGQPVSLGLDGSRTQKLASEALAKAGVKVRDVPLDPDDAFDALSLGAVRAIAVSGARDYAMMDRIPVKFGVHRLSIAVRDSARNYAKKMRTAALERDAR